MFSDTIHVLMIEDDEPYRVLLAKALGSRHCALFTPVFANSIHDAEIIAKDREFDVVLLDLFLGAHRGLESLVEARRRFRDTPIIVLTCHEDDMLADECVAHGAQDYLVKHKTDHRHIALAIRHAAETRRAARAAREQIHFLQSLMESIPCPIFMKDTSLVFRACNSAFLNKFGTDRRQLVGTSGVGLFPTPDAEAIHCVEVELLRSQGSGSCEVSISEGNDTVSSLILHEAAYKRSDGSIAGIVGIVFDITELRRNEATLKASEEFIVTILDSIQSGVLVAERQSGTVLLCNEKAADMLEQAKESVTGAESWIDVPTLPQILSDASWTPGMTASYEFPIRRDGRNALSILARTSAVSTQFGDLLVASLTDITKLKQIESALLKANEQILRRAKAGDDAGNVTVDTSQGPVIQMEWGVTPGWPVVACSEAIARLGYSPEQLTSQGVVYADLIHPDDLADFMAAVARMTDDQHPLEMVYRLLDSKGMPVEVIERRALEFDSDGKISKHKGYVIDLSAVKARRVHGKSGAAVGNAP